MEAPQSPRFGFASSSTRGFLALFLQDLLRQADCVEPEHKRSPGTAQSQGSDSPGTPVRDQPGACHRVPGWQWGGGLGRVRGAEPTPVRQGVSTWGPEAQCAESKSSRRPCSAELGLIMSWKASLKDIPVIARLFVNVNYSCIN